MMRDSRTPLHFLFKMLIASLALFSIHASAGTEVVLFVADSDWDADTYGEIHVVKPTGKQHAIIRPRYAVNSASIDPTGTWIVYTPRKLKELRIVSVNNRADRLLKRLTHIEGTDSPSMVSWSPNGRYILYTRLFTGRRIGVEVFDVRTRKIVNRHIVGSLRRNGYNLILRSIKWSPGSGSYLVDGLLEERPAKNPLFPEWNDEAFTIVYNRTRNKVRRVIRTSRILGYTTHGFTTNNHLMRVENTGNEIQQYDIRNGRTTRITELGPGSLVYNMAVHSSGKMAIMDGINLVRQFGQPDGFSEMTGTPRKFNFNRNFVRLDTRSLAGRFVTPLDDYSQFFPDSDQSPYYHLSTFEWKKISSDRIFKAKRCWGFTASITGTSGDDVIRGTRYQDVIWAGDGDDKIYSAGQGDIICAGLGDDIIKAGGGNDVVFADLTNQRNVDDWPLNGGNDTIEGGSQTNKLYGQSGDDTLKGGTDADQLDGGLGTDTCTRGDAIDCE